MSLGLVTIINYDVPDNFTYPPTIEVTTDAHLVLVDKTAQTFNQPFTSDTGFIYDPAKTEFVAGRLQQVDLAPANYVSWATYTSTIDLSCGSGVLTGTGFGGAAVAGNQLDLAHDDVRYVDYDADCNTGLHKYYRRRGFVDE